MHFHKKDAKDVFVYESNLPAFCYKAARGSLILGKGRKLLTFNTCNYKQCYEQYYARSDGSSEATEGSTASKETAGCSALNLDNPAAAASVISWSLAF